MILGLFFGEAVMGWITFLLLLLSVVVQTRSEEPACRLIGQSGFMEFFQDGDLIIGGVFSMRGTRILEDYGYQAVPYAYCKRRNDRELKFARTAVFAVEEINRESKLLPGVTLGYRLYQGCGSENLVRAAVEAVTGESCRKPTLALLGHSSSGVTMDINNILGPLDIPHISHLSTCACLSDKSLYPSFFRTVPSDQFQVTALVQLMKQFGWRWVGIVYSPSSYAIHGVAQFAREATKQGICLEFSTVYKKSFTTQVDDIEDSLKGSSARVVLLFMSLSYTKNFLGKMEGRNITGKQWIGSESWITQVDLASAQRKSILQGAIGFAIPEATVLGLADFLLSLRPSDEPGSAIIRAFWEDVFSCSFTPSNATRPCSGDEDLRTISNDYTDIKEFRSASNVYNAVYSVAHALRSLLQCEGGANPTTGKPCTSKDTVQPKQVLEHLRLVNFTTPNGQDVVFDGNGDSEARYDLVNWQMKEDGSVDIVTIGQYDGTFPEGQRFKLQERKIKWGANYVETPRSVCREPCPAGTRKAINKRMPVCCFDCFECPEGSISNETNSLDCFMCPGEFWPNAKKDKCIPKPTEFLSYKEIMGALLIIFCCLGLFLSLLTSIIFLVHKETPIVKANNSELSFLLLFSLKLCFLCSLTFIGRPSDWSCMLRHTAFGITFVLCISCVLGKTIVVLMAFRATLPGSNMMKWFGPLQQRLSVLAFTLIQVVICVLWLTIKPPFPNRNMRYYKEKIILECALGSALGFWAVLGYIGLLAALCFILAFLARKLPDSFNEAKFITFSMLIFCAVWIAFIPAYVSSPGKFTVAVEIFAILASSFGLLFCIFLPKCYIIIFKPERNSRKSLMSKIPRRSI